MEELLFLHVNDCSQFIIIKFSCIDDLLCWVMYSRMKRASCVGYIRFLDFTVAGAGAKPTNTTSARNALLLFVCVQHEHAHRKLQKKI